MIEDSVILSIPPKGIKLKFNYVVLLIFSILEVLLYDSNPFFQIPVSIIEYLFIVATILIDKKIGVSYFLAFTLLSMGAWSYVIQEELPSNFWGIRVAGFSLNILFSGLLFLYLVLSNGIETLFQVRFQGIKYFNYYIIYSASFETP